MPHNGGDENCTTELDKATVPYPLNRGPIQNADRIRISNELTQDFPRLIPVDQEDERSAQRVKKVITLFGTVKGKTAGNEIKGFFVMQFRPAFMRESAPLNRKIAQE